MKKNKKIDEWLLSAIRSEIQIFIRENTIRTDSFKAFSDDFDVINAYEEGYEDGKYIEYLSMIYNEIKG